jgi:activating signal cointegrator 1
MTRFPVISLWQPWAELLIAGLKEYETRHWQAPQQLIGQIILIHAAKRWTKDEWHATNDLMRRFPRAQQAFDPEHQGKFTVTLGAIVGAVRLVACIPSETLAPLISDEERAYGNFAPQRYGWQMQVMKRADPPIAVKGQQGIWYWSKEE